MYINGRPFTGADGMDEQTVGDRLKEHIGRGRRMSIRAFAKQMSEKRPRPPGTTRAMIHRYLAGAEPPAAFIDAAAELLGVNREWLARGRGPRNEADALAASGWTGSMPRTESDLSAGWSVPRELGEWVWEGFVKGCGQDFVPARHLRPLAFMLWRRAGWRSGKIMRIYRARSAALSWRPFGRSAIPQNWTISSWRSIAWRWLLAWPSHSKSPMRERTDRWHASRRSAHTDATGVIYGDFRKVGGKRESLGTTDAKEAADKVAARLAQIETLMDQEKVAAAIAAERERDLQVLRREMGMQKTARLGPYSAHHLRQKAKSDRFTVGWLQNTEQRLSVAIDFFGADTELHQIGTVQMHGLRELARHAAREAREPAQEGPGTPRARPERSEPASLPERRIEPLQTRPG
jgi:hypothetical protein